MTKQNPDSPLNYTPSEKTYVLERANCEVRSAIMAKNDEKTKFRAEIVHIASREVVCTEHGWDETTAIERAIEKLRTMKKLPRGPVTKEQEMSERIDKLEQQLSRALDLVEKQQGEINRHRGERGERPVESDPPAETDEIDAMTEAQLDAVLEGQDIRIDGRWSPETKRDKVRDILSETVTN